MQKRNARLGRGTTAPKLDGGEDLVFHDPSAVGLALVRTAAVVLRARGDLVRITPEWVDAHIRPARPRPVERKQ